MEELNYGLSDLSPVRTSSSFSFSDQSELLRLVIAAFAFAVLDSNDVWKVLMKDLALVNCLSIFSVVSLQTEAEASTA